METVHATLNQIRQGTCEKRVKIAVIDTGLEMKHPILQQYIKTGQIGPQLSQDFTVSNAAEVIDDNLGHGTGCTHLLLKTCPTAMVYVAKVFDYWDYYRFSSESPYEHVVSKRIDKAIRMATEEWEVDIISMSLAFRTEKTNITDAIEFGRDRGVIFFAAAANWPKVGFPARLDEVIRVNSCTYKGEKSDFSPKFDCTKTLKNFSVIGEHLCVAYPPGLNYGNHEKRQSGTSMSTAIMAGMAALVLEFRNLWYRRQQRDYPRITTEGMLSIFSSMHAFV
ncbi:hypothetical protein ED733_006912 [Metarhizium rileyi]|uniref:Peptidase S8/S53 domain-containing protein n=1 Tax=Metarhizium rileyi (strain RCEF 4871) TaxID=1649241 RepID=A0A5C6GP51_METRR|nr:hypothetical protein ED733_006912 [Metarhizium rileyi]